MNRITYLTGVDIIQVGIWFLLSHSSEDLLSTQACPIYSINRRVNRPAQILISHRADGFHSRLLDFLSSRWTRPIYSIFPRVNGPGQSNRWAVRVNSSENYTCMYSTSTIGDNTFLANYRLPLYLVISTAQQTM